MAENAHDRQALAASALNTVFIFSPLRLPQPGRVGLKR
jgi:hypothetical protein